MPDNPTPPKKPRRGVLIAVAAAVLLVVAGAVTVLVFRSATPQDNTPEGVPGIDYPDPATADHPGSLHVGVEIPQVWAEMIDPAVFSGGSVTFSENRGYELRLDLVDGVMTDPHAAMTNIAELSQNLCLSAITVNDPESLGRIVFLHDGCSHSLTAEELIGVIELAGGHDWSMLTATTPASQTTEYTIELVDTPVMLLRDENPDATAPPGTQIHFIGPDHPMWLYDDGWQQNHPAD